jgi:hypothetical protein
VSTASPRYLLAMKLMAMRFGEDDEDIEILLEECAIHDAHAAPAHSGLPGFGGAAAPRPPVGRTRRSVSGVATLCGYPPRSVGAQVPDCYCALSSVASISAVGRYRSSWSGSSGSNG